MDSWEAEQTAKLRDAGWEPVDEGGTVWAWHYGPLTRELSGADITKANSLIILDCETRSYELYRADFEDFSPRDFADIEWGTI